MTRTVAAPELTRFVLPDSVRVLDEAKREIEVCATSEAVDTFGTVFDYSASKDAFTRWAGNVREMHERKAVGRKVDVRFDDAAKKVYVRLRISKGAQDTWEKVLDGTLSGASIGASNVAWRNVQRGASIVPVATSYDLMELSLVDLASNPDAQGIAFVRDGAPTDTVDAGGVENTAGIAATTGNVDAGDIPAGSPAAAAADTSLHIREGAGIVSGDDVSALIASAALARGQAAITSGEGVSAGKAVTNVTGADAKRARLAGLGAPGYVGTTPTAVAAPAPEAARASAAGPGATYDGDGDHDGNVPVSANDGTADLTHDAGMHAHAAHEHDHSGSYTGSHDHSGAHLHEDGTAHDHPHSHDHAHHDHYQLLGSGSDDAPSHTHGHVHRHGHEHYYRVADGAPLDARLVSVEQVRTWEYVSASAFAAAGGTAGTGLSVPQFRTAQSHEIRALGAYSRNPDGAPDSGVPAQAEQHSSEALTGEAALGDGNSGTPALDGGAGTDLEAELHRTGRCPLCQGQIRALDRDGQAVSGGAGDASGSAEASTATMTTTTGMLDVSAAPEGWSGRQGEAEVTRTLEATVTRLLGPVAETLRGLADRVTHLEAQPMPGGPVLRAADKGSPLSSQQGSGGQPGVADRLAALESLAGRIADPQAQVAVAAEMIRLQQEAAGIAPAMQVMPTAGHRTGGRAGTGGNGWGITPR